MSILKQVSVKEKITTVEYPHIEGFEIKIAYLSRDELSKIRKNSLHFVYNSRSRQKEEVVDDDKFLEEYTRKTIKGWKGLKVKHLPELMVAEIGNVNPEQEVPYSEEDALFLIKNSIDFDQFITDILGDLSNFNKVEEEKEEKN